jgi:uncharacterized membrane-anchored protein
VWTRPLGPERASKTDVQAATLCTQLLASVQSANSLLRTRSELQLERQNSVLVRSPSASHPLLPYPPPACSVCESVLTNTR